MALIDIGKGQKALKRYVLKTNLIFCFRTSNLQNTASVTYVSMETNEISDLLSISASRDLFFGDIS